MNCPNFRSMAYVWIIFSYAPAIWSQSVLIPPFQTDGTPEIRFLSPGGEQLATVRPAGFSPKITILIDPSLVVGPQVSTLSSSLSRVLAKVKGRSLELILLTGDPPPPVTVTTSGQLRAGIRKLLADPSLGSAPVSLETLIHCCPGVS